MSPDQEDYCLTCCPKCEHLVISHDIADRCALCPCRPLKAEGN